MCLGNFHVHDIRLPSRVFLVCSGHFHVRDMRTIRQLPSGGLSGFFGAFSCVQRMYYLLTTKWQTFRRFLCARCTYHALPTIVGLAQAHPNQSLYISTSLNF